MIFFRCCFIYDLQFSMRTRTPSVNGSIYSPYSSNRKVGWFILCVILVDDVDYLCSGDCNCVVVVVFV